MLRLNRITDYAVVVLTQMANEPDKRVTAPQLSEESNVPAPTVAKVLKALAREGVLASQRGVNGGYRLARPAGDISMLEVIRALEGPISLTACVDGAEGDCNVELLCPVRGNWDRVNTAIRSALADVSLEDMAIPTMFGVPFRAAEGAAGVHLAGEAR
ncbi:MAG: SUF system Fe-S cluster assembly regulator [Rhodospirillaceae bacterium]|nr:SUF system Fe-S cluster assembly regulator [Rhodospirillaceae bacterium]